MPPSHPSSRPPGSSLRTLISFALIGFTTALLPFIVFSASYLIIPFPRPVVLFVEILPAIVTKLALPHLLYNVPYWIRPLVFSALWAILAFITSVTAPNVETPIRIISTTLAAATAAATEVSFLGLLRYYGKIGLVGWGFGTGLGALVCAVWPYVVAVHMGIFLRDAVVNIYYLAALVAFVYFVMLPGKPKHHPSATGPLERTRTEIVEDADEPGKTFSLQDPQTAAPGFARRVELNFRLTKAVLPPYMLPLFGAFVAQGIVFPGITRAMGTSSAFEGFSSYSATYGLAFQLGNLIARSSVLSIRYQKARPLLIRLFIVTVMTLINAFSLFISLPSFVFALATSTGLIAGAVYINTFAAALEDPGLQSGPDREFSLGVIGSGEAAGMLIGGLFGVLLESNMCHSRSASDRWCHAAR